MFTKGLFRRIFRPSPPASQIANPVETEKKASQEPVEEPVLPVEPGFHYSLNLDLYDRPKVAKLKADSLEHLWSAKASEENLQTDLREVKQKALLERIRDGEIERLIERDQTASDFDDREGHVVIPSSNFEYHGDLSAVRYPPTEGPTVRDGSNYTLNSEHGLLRYNSATQDTLYLPHQTKQVQGTSFDHHSNLLASAEFAISNDGDISIPSAKTLEDADEIAVERDLAQKAQDLLKYVDQVRGVSQKRLDQRSADHDERRGHVVSGGIGEYWFIRETALPHLEHQTYSVEMSPDHIRLYEDSYGKQPELVLSAKTEGTVTTVQHVRNQGNDSLHLVWNKSDGFVKAELRQDKNYKPPSPKQPPRVFSSERSYGYKAPSRSSRPKDALPYGFSSSNRIRSHGGGHHVMVKSGSGNPHDYNFPDKFTDPESGKSYFKTSYTVLDGSRLYKENISS